MNARASYVFLGAVSLFLIACSGATESHSQDADATVVGWVYDVTPKDEPAAELVRRPQETHVVKQGAEVRLGDKIRIWPGDAETTVNVAFVDGSRKRFGPEPSEWIIRLEGKPSGPWANALSEFFRQFAEAEHRRIFPYSREDPEALTILPGMSSDISRVTEGTRPFYVSWVGGTPPFSVTIIHSTTSHSVYSVADLFVREIYLESVELNEDEYVISIQHAAGDEAFSFKAEKASITPTLTISEGHDLGPVFDLVNAHYLASTDGGAWTLEAYQRLYPLAREGFAPAIDMLRTIQTGYYDPTIAGRD